MKNAINPYLFLVIYFAMFSLPSVAQISLVQAIQNFGEYFLSLEKPRNDFRAPLSRKKHEELYDININAFLPGNPDLLSSFPVNINKKAFPINEVRMNTEYTPPTIPAPFLPQKNQWEAMDDNESDEQSDVSDLLDSGYIIQRPEPHSKKAYLNIPDETHNETIKENPIPVPVPDIPVSESKIITEETKFSAEELRPGMITTPPAAQEDEFYFADDFSRKVPTGTGEEESKEAQEQKAKQNQADSSESQTKEQSLSPESSTQSTSSATATAPVTSLASENTHTASSLSMTRYGFAAFDREYQESRPKSQRDFYPRDNRYIIFPEKKGAETYLTLYGPDADSGQLTKLNTLYIPNCRGFRFSADGEHLMTFSKKDILVWKLPGANGPGEATTLHKSSENVEVVKSYSFKNANIEHMKLSEDGQIRCFINAGEDIIHVADMEVDDSHYHFGGKIHIKYEASKMREMDISPNKKFLIVLEKINANGYSHMIIFNLENGKKQGMTYHKSTILKILISENSQNICIVRPMIPKIFQLETGTLIQEQNKDNLCLIQYRDAAFSHNSEYLVFMIFSLDYLFAIWRSNDSFATWEESFVPRPEHDARMMPFPCSTSQIEFNSDDQYVVAFDGGSTLMICALDSDDHQLHLVRSINLGFTEADKSFYAAHFRFHLNDQNLAYVTPDTDCRNMVLSLLSLDENEDNITHDRISFTVMDDSESEDFTINGIDYGCSGDSAK